MTPILRSRSVLHCLLLGGCLLLSACGFKLRQDIVLPASLATIKVSVADPYSPLQRNLEVALRRSGAAVVETADGVAVLRVFRNSLQRLPLSVGDTGRVQEFVLRYVVTFELVDASGLVVVPRQDVELERDYSFDTIQAQGTPGEEEVMRAELEREIVQSILRRVDAVLR